MSDDAHVSRRLPDGVEQRPMGWWGTVLFAMVLATTYGALYFTYVYVRVATFAWPPGDLPPPPLGLATMSALTLALSCAPMSVAARAATRRTPARHRGGLLLAVVLAVVHSGLLLVDWKAQPFTVGQHAYTSLYYVLPGLHLFLVGVAVLFALTVLALSWHAETGLHRVGAQSLAAYWYTVAAGGVVLLAVVYLVPHVWRGALVPA